jgi:hemerythrin-like domain-containing protein
MLTATYSFVAIAAEQDKTRSMLQRLQQYIQTTWKGLQNIDFAFLETAFSKLMQFDKFCHSRKLEVHLIPALRAASREAEALIAELDSLSASGMTILHSLGELLAKTFDSSAIKVNQICHAMESYCDYLRVRLDREERELIPLARRVFSVEDWFTIAAHFLSDDTHVEGGRRQSRRRRAAPAIVGPTVSSVR